MICPPFFLAQIRVKTKQALLQYTDSVIKELREQGTEMMRGVDWAAVEAYVDLRKTLNKVRGLDSVVSCPRCRGDRHMGSCMTCVHSVKVTGEFCLLIIASSFLKCHFLLLRYLSGASRHH